MRPFSPHVKRFLLLSAALIGLTPCLLHAQEAPAPDFQAQIEAILKQFNGKKYDEVVKHVDALLKQNPDDAFLLNLQGAAYTRLKDYPAAEKSFRAALDKQPGLFAAQFNIGEIQFLQQKYREAFEHFSSMLLRDPGNELLQFKTFLCLLQMKDEDRAKQVLARIRYPGETPAWYYSQAAWELSKGNKSKASNYLSTAKTLYRDKIEIYDETFRDLDLPTK
jgi:predicted Zn-dependent protease